MSADLLVCAKKKKLTTSVHFTNQKPFFTLLIVDFFLPPVGYMYLFVPHQTKCGTRTIYVGSPAQIETHARPVKKLRASHGLPIWRPMKDTLKRTTGAREYNPLPTSGRQPRLHTSTQPSKAEAQPQSRSGAKINPCGV